jgi:hypothetical protein
MRIIIRAESQRQQEQIHGLRLKGRGGARLGGGNELLDGSAKM